MSAIVASVIGVAIEASVVRAAMRVHGQLSVAEVSWDPSSPETAVDLLRERFGHVQSIALSVGLAYLEIAQADLPPLAASDQRRVLLRDADRYFPVEGGVAIRGPGKAGIAFATSGERLHRWIRALEEWAPVRAVVAVPDAIVAGVSMGHRTGSPPARTMVIESAPEEIGLLSFRDGAAVEVRRLPMATHVSPPAGAEVLSELLLPGATGAYAAAVGAIALANAPLAEMLLDSRLEADFQSQRARRGWTSVAIFAGALVLLGVAIDARHNEALRAHQQASDSLLAASEPARMAAVRLAELEREARILNARDTAADPLSIVATLSRLLPRDVFVERVHWDGAEWRIDGSADQAASIVPSLDSMSRFTNVRVLTASTRFRDGARVRESFSVAFKVMGDSVATR